MKAKPRYRMISWVAERYNVHPQTLRLWEREGLLLPNRSQGNTRLYDDETCQRLEKEWAQVKEGELAPLTEADKAMIRKLAKDVPALWHAETTTPAERKRLLHCLIQDVTLDAMAKPGFSLIHIRWHTGTTTTVEAERPRAGCWTSRTVVERIRELAQHTQTTGSPTS